MIAIRVQVFIAAGAILAWFAALAHAQGPCSSDSDCPGTGSQQCEDGRCMPYDCTFVGCQRFHKGRFCMGNVCRPRLREGTSCYWAPNLGRPHTEQPCQPGLVCSGFVTTICVRGGKGPTSGAPNNVPLYPDLAAESAAEKPDDSIPPRPTPRTTSSTTTSTTSRSTSTWATTTETFGSTWTTTRSQTSSLSSDPFLVMRILFVLVFIVSLCCCCCFVFGKRHPSPSDPSGTVPTKPAAPPAGAGDVSTSPTQFPIQLPYPPSSSPTHSPDQSVYPPLSPELPANAEAALPRPSAPPSTAVTPAITDPFFATLAMPSPQRLLLSKPIQASQFAPSPQPAAPGSDGSTLGGPTLNSEWSGRGGIHINVAAGPGDDELALPGAPMVKDDDAELVLPCSAGKDKPV